MKVLQLEVQNLQVYYYLSSFKLHLLYHIHSSMLSHIFRVFTHTSMKPFQPVFLLCNLTVIISTSPPIFFVQLVLSRSFLVLKSNIAHKSRTTILWYGGTALHRSIAVSYFLAPLISTFFLFHEILFFSSPIQSFSFVHFVFVSYIFWCLSAARPTPPLLFPSPNYNMVLTRSFVPTIKIISVQTTCAQTYPKIAKLLFCLIM